MTADAVPNCYSYEHEHEDSGVNLTDALEAGEPGLAAETHGLECAPEAVAEVEPKGAEPYEVNEGVDVAESTVAEGLGDPVSTVGSEGHVTADELGEHHVVPEVVEVEQHTEDDDDAEHEHVLACPFYACRLVGNSVLVLTTSLLILKGQDERVNEVESNECCEADGSNDCIPVGTEHFADPVVALRREESNHVHASMERKEQDEGDAGNRHDHLASDGGSS